MKLSNKLIIFSVCICVLSAALLSSKWLSISDDNTSRKSVLTGKEENKFKTIETENNISKPVRDESARVTYTLVLEDGKICAFMTANGGNRILWNSMELPPTLSDEEKTRLENGIHTTSFEELCFFFESYAS